MSELMVFAFDTEDGALQIRDKLLEIRKRRLVQLADAAVVVRRQDGKVGVKQLTNLPGGGAFGRAFWGLLIGLLFTVPWLAPRPLSGFWGLPRLCPTSCSLALRLFADGTGIEVLRTPYGAPKANAICERLLGSVRRECLDHLLILSERHLHRVIKQ